MTALTLQQRRYLELAAWLAIFLFAVILFIAVGGASVVPAADGTSPYSSSGEPPAKVSSVANYDLPAVADTALP
ncbi:MAG: hypothetical protein P9L99_15760 [Candidatus Lernaella stagnicola]|nr:hypothetical protein [Candidatus Lernaella stagnicola]